MCQHTRTLDAKRVEILKGPQSTLFGRNTLGGAISIILVAPSFDPGLSVRTGIGIDFNREVEIIGGGAIIPDVLAGRIALRRSGQDGFSSSRTMRVNSACSTVGGSSGSPRLRASLLSEARELQPPVV